MTGKLTLGGQHGAIIRWERSVDGGAQYTPIGSTANPYNFSEGRSVRLRAVVKDGSCAEAFSTAVDVTPIQPVASSLTSTPSITECDRYTGSIQLNSDYQGDQITWQKNEGSGWLPITGQSGTSFNFDISSSTSFRAGVAYTASQCPPDYTQQVDINMPKPVAGTIALAYSSFTCTLVAGSLTVQNYSGDKITWEQNEGSGWGGAGQSGTTLSFSLDKRVSYRAKVEWQASSCAGVYTQPIQVGPPAPTGGFLAPSELNITCGRSTGILDLQGYWGNKITWQVNTGGGFVDVSSGVSANFQFDV
ncbi:MAG: hypothetical protein RIB86_25735, partial [Imperialibacter sp.]